MEGVLVLEDGKVVRGAPFGARTTVFGELVFNTNMTGYCEALTDPSYKGQVLMMTYPLMGNYGVDPETFESQNIQATGFVIRELWRGPSHPSSKMSLDEFLSTHGVPGIEGVDTRDLTIRTRVQGTVRAALSTEGADPHDLLQEVRSRPFPDVHNLVEQVSCSSPEQHRGTGPLRFALVDCGVKGSILSNLLSYGDVLQVPYDTAARDIMEWDPHGLLVSNGPGNPAHPEMLSTVVPTLRTLAGQLPILGICLGHQLLGLAFGAETYKLKFGHRGGNHPVRDLNRRKVFITSQNHGFAVLEEGLGDELEVTHVNLNDRTVEGFKHREVPVLSVQYHPEANPGPHDSLYVFQEFVREVESFALEAGR
ncbi:MAG: glutamine-hydrolyzing carbamoyl-phosphate synthase small subunit [Thermoplasmata archaeon]